MPGAASFRTASIVLIFMALAISGCERPSHGNAHRRSNSAVLPPTADKPDIILILVDALRADCLDVYGHPTGLTPTMDRIAAEGVVMEQCVAAAPWTAPSVASLFVSYYPGVHKTMKYSVRRREGEQILSARQSVLSDDFETLAETLQRQGYQTAAFCANRLVRERYGYAQGFEHFDASVTGNTVPGRVVNGKLAAWLAAERDPNRPLFVYLHYMDVHGPYDAAPRFTNPRVQELLRRHDLRKLTDAEWQAMTRYLRQPPKWATGRSRYDRLKRYREYWVARYEAGVAECDAYLSQLVDELEQAGIWDDAYVLLMSDHGESLCEHGAWDHGLTQYQEELHVPLILRWPAVLSPGTRVPGRISLIDVMPTLAEQLRLPAPKGIQGVSFVPLLEDLPRTSPAVRLAEADKHGVQSALFHDDWKLLITCRTADRLAAGMVRPEDAYVQLFDLSNDPGESRNLADDEPEIRAALVHEYDDLMEQSANLKPGVAAQDAQVEPEVIERLRAIGYTGGYAPGQESNAAPAATQPGGTPR